jgi:hypothetical protein
MTTEQIALDVVETLNSEIGSEKYEHPFEFISDGYSCAVNFLGMRVWDTENDPSHDENDQPIDLEAYVRKAAKDIITFVNTFKL